MAIKAGAGALLTATVESSLTGLHSAGEIAGVNARLRANVTLLPTILNATAAESRNVVAASDNAVGASGDISKPGYGFIRNGQNSAALYFEGIVAGLPSLRTRGSNGFDDRLAYMQDVSATNIRAFTTVGTSAFVVPAGVFSVSLHARGGGGGGGGNPGAPYGGNGGRGTLLAAQLTVTPGQVIPFTVGGGGEPGVDSQQANTRGNGGAGGGATTVDGSLVAGGGGGGGGSAVNFGSYPSGPGGSGGNNGGLAAGSVPGPAVAGTGGTTNGGAGGAAAAQGAAGSTGTVSNGGNPAATAPVPYGVDASAGQGGSSGVAGTDGYVAFSW